MSKANDVALPFADAATIGMFEKIKHSQILWGKRTQQNTSLLTTTYNSESSSKRQLL